MSTLADAEGHDDWLAERPDPQDADYHPDRDATYDPPHPGRPPVTPRTRYVPPTDPPF